MNRGWLGRGGHTKILRLAAWVRPFRGSGGPWLVDSDGGYPVWPRAGHEIFYVSRSTGRMMAASYTVTGAAVILYEDATAEEKPITRVTFLLNFFDELRRRLTPGK